MPNETKVFLCLWRSSADTHKICTRGPVVLQVRKKENNCVVEVVDKHLSEKIQH